MSREIPLTPAQAAVLYVLTTKFRFATASKISEILGWSEAHIRKMLSDLRKMGLTDFVLAGFLGKSFGGGRLGGMIGLLGIKADELREIGEMDPRVKLHYATITFEQLKKMYPDVEKWQKLAEK
ncbi:MAG: hypothetical protein QXT06_04075 [Candidatus Bathyarchaeia archaeon]